MRPLPAHCSYSQPEAMLTCLSVARVHCCCSWARTLLSWYHLLEVDWQRSELRSWARTWAKGRRSSPRNSFLLPKWRSLCHTLSHRTRPSKSPNFRGPKVKRSSNLGSRLCRLVLDFRLPALLRSGSR